MNFRDELERLYEQVDALAHAHIALAGLAVELAAEVERLVDLANSEEQEPPLLVLRKGPQ